MRRQGLEIAGTGDRWMVGDVCSLNWRTRGSGKFRREKDTRGLGDAEFNVSVGYPGRNVAQAVALHSSGDEAVGRLEVGGAAAEEGQDC